MKIAPSRENAEAVADTILLAFDPENNMLPYLDRVAKMFPEIPSLVHPEMGRETILSTVEELIGREKQANRQQIEEQLRHFQELAQGVLSEGVAELLEMFQLWDPAPLRFTCWLGLYNPFPRSVLKKEYFLHYDVSDQVFLRASLHEINHMVLFDKWCVLQGVDCHSEPEFPDTLWYLEELAVAPTLNDPRIQKIVPVRHSAYQSLEEILVDGIPLSEQIQRIYGQGENIPGFLREAYDFLVKNGISKSSAQ